MAVGPAVIEAVRVVDGDGLALSFPWSPSTWYLIRDDHPYVDVLVRGCFAQAHEGGKLHLRDEPSEEGTRWQRWDLEAELARNRRLGEVSLALKVPNGSKLQCYVVPTALLSYRDVVTMIEDIEAEVGVAATWDVLSERPDRSWSRRGDRAHAGMPTELIDIVEEELRSALQIRRHPFDELAPASRRDVPLAENALVSQWATRRSAHLYDAAATTASVLEQLEQKRARGNPEGRRARIDKGIRQAISLERRLLELKGLLSRLVNASEMGVPVSLGPLLQRDHRLRTLLRAFAPMSSEVLSEVESSRSHYPPTYLNRIWELWGAVWLAKELRRMGFSGTCTHETSTSVQSCSWSLTRGDVSVDLDFEPEPTLVDYDTLPPPHQRRVSALEWAACNQGLDPERPFVALEARCSPDYMLRITGASRESLIVGDACLASPKHHGKKADKADAKPHVVERYRRTIGWATGNGIVRCHPLGAFVLFPAPSAAWAQFENLPGAADCTLLCPSPHGEPEASRRLEAMLASIEPNMG